MKIIQSHDVPSKLMNVILTAKKELVIVSPYVNLTYTKQVSAALVAARNKGVRIDFYIRDEPNNSVSRDQVRSLGLTPRLIPNLHAKLYFNETTGLIASLNLLSSSIGNSIEIGGQLETPAELAELRLFVEQFITPHEVGAAPPPLPPAASIPTPAAPPLTKEEKEFQQQEFGQLLAHYLMAKVDRRTFIEGNADSLRVKAVGNTFTVEVENTFGSAQLALQGVVSSSEADRFAAKSAKHYHSAAYSYLIRKGGKGYYDQVRAVRKTKLSAQNFNDLTFAEKKQILAEIAAFLLATQAFKADYKN